MASSPPVTCPRARPCLALLAILLGCRGSDVLDQPAPPPEWPLHNIQVNVAPPPEADVPAEEPAKAPAEPPTEPQPEPEPAPDAAEEPVPAEPAPDAVEEPATLIPADPAP